MKKLIEELIIKMLRFAIIHSQNPVGDGLESLLSIKDSSGALPAAISSFIVWVWGLISVAAMGLTLIYFLLEMNQKYALEGGDMTYKSMVAPFAKLCIVLAIFMFGGEICGGMIDMNDAFIAGASTLVIDDGSGSGESGDSGLYEEPAEGEEDWVDNLLKSKGLPFTTVAAIMALLMFVISLIIGFMFMYKAFQYKLEFIYRVSVSPLAFTDCYNGLNSQAIRWIKGFVGMCLYGVAFCVLPTLAIHLAMSSALGETESLIDFVVQMAQMVVAPIAALGALGAVKEICKEATA